MKISRLFAALLLVIAPVSTAFAEEAKIDQFDFEPNPAIWKLADEDTTIYLFGTVHLLPSKLKWRTEKFDNIVKEVDSLVVETSDQDFDESEGFEQILLQMADNVDRAPLADRVKPENRDALTEVATFTELPLEVLDLMPTWMVSFLVYFKSIEGAEEAGEYGSSFGVETVLEAEFAKMKKPIGSIEDGAAIIDALSNLPDAEQLVMVDDLLDAWRTEGREVVLGLEETTPDSKADGSVALDYSGDIAWAKGELDDIPKELNEEILGKGFYKVLIRDRNAAWTEWLQDRLERPGKILLAVGTGHLVGKDSVQNMLAEKGLAVERLQ